MNEKRTRFIVILNTIQHDGEYAFGNNVMFCLFAKRRPQNSKSTGKLCSETGIERTWTTTPAPFTPHFPTTNERSQF